MAKEERVKYNYQYDSTARAYELSADPVRIPVPSEPKRQTKIASKSKVDFVFGMQMSMCGIVLFACAILYVHGYSSLRAKQTHLNDLKAEKVTVVNQIKNVEAKMTKQLDLDTIKERAINELGMQKPLAYQIVYIDLPEQSHTTYDE